MLEFKLTWKFDLVSYHVQMDVLTAHIFVDKCVHMILGNQVPTSAYSRQLETLKEMRKFYMIYEGW